MRPRQRKPRILPLALLVPLASSTHAVGLFGELETYAHPPPNEPRKLRHHEWDFPSEISIKAGVLAAAPYAMYREDNGEPIWSGFQIDLLRRFQIFARENDNITLTFDFQPSPPHYTDALDLIANDCNTTQNPQPLEDCQQFDIIVANYYATAERHLRVHLSDPFLQSGISAVKYLDKQPGSKDYTTLSQAQEAQAPICLKDGAYYATVVRERFPRATYFSCNNQDECIQALKREDCVLYSDDQLFLLYTAAWDPSLEVTKERFNTQYIVWAYSYALPQTTLTLLDKWMRDAVTNATTDELYYKYFQKALCPIGTAGEQCELPCDPDHGQSNARGVCICQSTKWTGDDCSIEVEENVNSLTSGMVIGAYIMFGLNVLTIFVCGAWLFLERGTPQVIVSQPSFLWLVLLGCLISSSTILALAQEDTGDGPVKACQAIPWLYSVGFCVTFGTLFAKIRRIYLIFKNAVVMRRTTVTVQETLAVIAAVLVIDIVILVLWTVLDPLTWQRKIVTADQFGEPLESIGYCTAEHWAIWAGLIATLHLLLLAVASFMCYASRNIPTQFNEGKYLTVAMVSNMQIFVVGLPILIIIGADPQTGFFVRTVIIWMNDFVVVSLIFGNLIYSVHFHPERNERVDTSVKDVVGSAMQEFRERSGRMSNQSRGSGADHRHSYQSRGSSRQFGSTDETSEDIGSNATPFRAPNSSIALEAAPERAAEETQDTSLELKPVTPTKASK